MSGSWRFYSSAGRVYAHRGRVLRSGPRPVLTPRFGAGAKPPSVARDEAGDGSDIDVLVDFEPGTRLSYFRVFDRQERLKELLGTKVDLVTTGGLRSELRDGILAEAIHAA